jgi:MSHA biogenesis protein MshM
MGCHYRRPAAGGKTMMYLQQFGLKHDPFGKQNRDWLSYPQYEQLRPHLTWLLETKGIGVLTGEAGIGKTASVREWVKSLNPLTHQVFYQADNHFRAFDIYSQLAESLGLGVQHRYCKLWRSLKQELLHLSEEKKVTPIWILDEAQQLPFNFFTELPSFLNFSFDTREVMIILLVGGTAIQSVLQRSVCAPLASRLQFHFEWKALEDFELFRQVVEKGLSQAGCHQSILSQSAIKLLHMASKGRLRYVHQIVTKCLQMATEKNPNHLPDELVQESIRQLKTAATH